MAKTNNYAKTIGRSENQSQSERLEIQGGDNYEVLQVRSGAVDMGGSWDAQTGHDATVSGT